jgi:hypothetical protein
VYDWMMLNGGKGWESGATSVSRKTRANKIDMLIYHSDNIRESPSGVQPASFPHADRPSARSTPRFPTTSRRRSRIAFASASTTRVETAQSAKCTHTRRRDRDSQLCGGTHGCACTHSGGTPSERPARSSLCEQYRGGALPVRLCTCAGRDSR